MYPQHTSSAVGAPKSLVSLPLVWWVRAGLTGLTAFLFLSCHIALFPSPQPKLPGLRASLCYHTKPPWSLLKPTCGLLASSPSLFGPSEKSSWNPVDTQFALGSLAPVSQT